MNKTIRKRIKTNIRQARTIYKIRSVWIAMKIIARGEFTIKGFKKHWKGVLTGSPRYPVKLLINQK